MVLAKALRSAKSAYPSFAIDWLNLVRARARFPQALYVNSPGVSLDAVLGMKVGIGRDVVINAGVSIDDYSYINRGAIVFSGQIGKFCSIAHYAQIGAEVHPTEFLSTSPFIYGNSNIIGASANFNEFPHPPKIGSDVWIGSHAVIMQGVTIGHGAIVGAGAVVTKDVDPYAVVAGVPAKLLRRRFNDQLCEDLLKLSWWELPLETLEQWKAKIGDPGELLNSISSST